MNRRLGAAAVVVASLGASALAWISRSRTGPGGNRLIGTPRGYDLGGEFLFRPFYRRIAEELVPLVPPDGSLLDVGCGPGQLDIELARLAPGIRVTGLDVDESMIARAEAKAARLPVPYAASRPRFVIGDVAALPFPDGSFDAIVSTLSMHHWADPAAGLAEIHRVLRPGGRAAVWELAPRIRALENRMPDLAGLAAASPFGGATPRPWRWPWGLPLTERLDLVRGAADEAKPALVAT